MHRWHGPVVVSTSRCSTVPSYTSLHRVLALVAASCALVGLAVCVPATAATPVVDLAQARAQCAAAPLGRTSWANDATYAREIMGGRVSMPPYGYMVLPQDPTWKVQSTLDGAGNNHQHSLRWALPLLREGRRLGDQAMVDRFYDLVQDWAQDNLYSTTPDTGMLWSPMVMGLRAQTLVCGVDGPQGQQPWYLDVLRLNAQRIFEAGDPTPSSNNTYLHGQMGALASACALQDEAWTRTAVDRLSSIAGQLVLADGSVTEQALSYAVANYQWFDEAIDHVEACGEAVPPSLLRREQIPGFIAHAIRPDGRLEALGDTTAEPVDDDVFPGTAAEYAISAGATGAPPTDLFRSFQSGTVFSRSGWGTGSRSFADETFWSLQTGPGNAAQGHAHDDAGSLTLHARGTQLLHDVGQYVYTIGPTRNWVKSRDSHNSVLVPGLKPDTTKAAEITHQVHTAAYDLVTVSDPSFMANGVKLVRTVYYDRRLDYLVVLDHATATEARDFVLQWNLPAGKTVDVTGGRSVTTASTTGSGGNVSLALLGPEHEVEVLEGSQDPIAGWSSSAYGSLSPSPSVHATRNGTSVTFATVILPRGSNQAAGAVRAFGEVSGGRATLDVVTPGGADRLTLNRYGLARNLVPTVTGSAYSDPSGTSADVRVSMYGRLFSPQAGAAAASTTTSVQGRTVTLRSGSVVLGTALTDAKGRFVVSGTSRPARVLTVTTATDALLPAGTKTFSVPAVAAPTAPTVAATASALLTADPARRSVVVQGSLTHARSDLLPGRTVVLSANASGGATTEVARTVAGADGRFTLRGTAAGGAALVVTAPGAGALATASRTLAAPVAPAPEKPVVTVTSATATPAGSQVTVTGVGRLSALDPEIPLGGRPVRLSTKSATGQTVYVGSATTGSDGSFRVSGLVPAGSAMRALVDGSDALETAWGYFTTPPPS